MPANQFVFPPFSGDAAPGVPVTVNLSARRSALRGLTLATGAITISPRSYHANVQALGGHCDKNVIVSSALGRKSVQRRSIHGARNRTDQHHQRRSSEDRRRKLRQLVEPPDITGISVTSTASGTASTWRGVAAAVTRNRRLRPPASSAHPVRQAGHTGAPVRCPSHPQARQDRARPRQGLKKSHRDWPSMSREDSKLPSIGPHVNHGPVGLPTKRLPQMLNVAARRLCRRARRKRARKSGRDFVSRDRRASHRDDGHRDWLGRRTRPSVAVLRRNHALDSLRADQGVQHCLAHGCRDGVIIHSASNKRRSQRRAGGACRSLPR